MNSTNKLGLTVVLIMGAITFFVFAIIFGVRLLFQRQSAQPAQESVIEGGQLDSSRLLSDQDSDSDGLADDLEAIYRTDPGNPDTDSDGTMDGEEVAVLRNPAQPGPDDALFTDEGTSTVFEENTYTNQYLALFAPNAGREDVLSQERIEAFVDEQRQEFLPAAFQLEIVTTDEAGATAIETYLDAISAAHNPRLTVVTSDMIAEAFQSSISNADPSALDAIAAQLENNLAVLQEVPAPTEVIDLHTQFLAASKALLENVVLLQHMPNDFVGGLIGAKNVGEIGGEFQDIADQIVALEAKYGLE